MSGGNTPDDPGGEPPDLEQLARDWITLWQSELAGLATDRETQETWQALIALWAGTAEAALATMPRAAPGAANERADRRSGPAAPARAAPAADAPDPRDAAIDRLIERIAALEARLDELERRRGTGGPRRGPRQRSG